MCASGESLDAMAALDHTQTTRFILFDFTMVSGLDATAARSCFLNLCRTLTPLGITLVFGGVAPGGRVEKLLIGHEILHAKPPSPVALRFDTIDEALEHCEEVLLAESAAQKQATATPPGGDGESLALKRLSGASHDGGGGGGPLDGRRDGNRRGSASLSQVLSPLVEVEWSDMLEGLAPFFRERRYSNGQLIFRKGAHAHSIYFITCGEVTLWEQEPSGEDVNGHKAHERAAVSASSSALNVNLGRRLVRYVDGGIFGELDFFLRHPRSFAAVASTNDCTVQVLTRDALQSMQAQASGLAAALEHALLKYLSFQVNAKLGISDGVRDVRTS